MAEVTIRTIATEAGVSPSLVSQVLNDRPVRVAAQTRERIHAVAKKYHYVPNKLASCLKSKQTRIIALLAPFTPNGFFSNLIYHVQHYAYQAGYLSIVINTFDDPEREGEALDLYQSGMFDGMLVAPRGDDSNLEIFRRMETDGFPFVFVDRPLETVSAPSVASDHFTIGMELTRKALETGKRDIVYLYNSEDCNTALTRRRDGYRQALLEAGLEPVCCGFSCEETENGEYIDAMIQALGKLGRQPEVFFVHSGYYVPHLVYACKRLGYSLNDLFFLSVDGYSFNERWLDIPDTIRQIEGHCDIAIQDIDMIAKEAVGVLLSRLQDTVISSTRTFVPVQMVKF